MRLLFILLFSGLTFCAAAQADSVFRTRVHTIVQGFETHFANYPRAPKPSALPSQKLWIRPGLISVADELVVQGDTLYQYGSLQAITGDSSVLRPTVARYDRLLGEALGAAFQREAYSWHFNERSPVAVRYRGARLRVALSVTKLGADRYLLLIGFTGKPGTD